MIFDHDIAEDVNFSRADDERHATLSAGWFRDGEPATITRPEAAKLALALIDYAESLDPGPGAPFPSSAVFRAQQRVAYLQQDVEEDGHGGWRTISPEGGALGAIYDRLSYRPVSAAGPAFYKGEK